MMQRILQPVLKLIRRVLREAKPEMAGDLLKNGLLLSGGSALLDGLKDWLAGELHMPVFVPALPGEVLAMGCYQALGMYKDLPLLIENGEKYYGGA